MALANWSRDTVHMTDDDAFGFDECRNPEERELAHGLNARAAPWVLAGVTLIGPVVQQYDERKLVFFLDPPGARLLRVEYHYGRAVIGRDLTGQGGPDLDPSAPGVFTIVAPGDDAGLL